jgi:hypothetical protein
MQQGDLMMKTFRLWLQEKWFEHKDELASLNMGVPDYNIQEYFNRHKYWLKREYRYQRSMGNV